MPTRGFRLFHPGAGSAAPLAGTARWPLPLDLAVLAALALVGIVHLAMPLLFDQAIFLMGAKRMAAGGALYRDFWDLKQPGIYFFYWLGGRLFGFDERGVHLLELLLLLAASAFQQRALRRICDDARFAALSPLLTWGLYYAAADGVQMTQVESLAGVPLLLELELALAGGETGAPLPWFLAGVCGGAALVLKLVFAPLVGVLWAAGAAAAFARDRARRAGALAGGTALFALGLAVPLALTAAYLAAHGALHDALYLGFVYPKRMLAYTASRRLDVLVGCASWFLARWSGVLAFAALGLWLGGARGTGRRLGAYAAWLVTGLAVILVQRWSWWAYHYMLIVVPVGVLATRGLELVAQGLARLEPARAPRLRIAALAACLLLLTALPAGFLLFKSAEFVRCRFALRAADREHFQERVDVGGDTARITGEVAFLSAPGARPGTLFTVGNAMYNSLSGRDFPGTRFAGLLPDKLSRAEWDRFGDVVTREAPAWIFVQDPMRPGLVREPERGSRFVAALTREYVFSHHSAQGDWYERAVRGAAAADTLAR